MKPRQPRRPKRTKQAGILSQGTRSCKKFISDFFFLFEKTWCDLFFSFLYQEYQVQTCFSWMFFVLITNGMAFSSLEYLARLAANYHRRQPARKSLRPVNSRCFEKAAWRPAAEFPSVDVRFDGQTCSNVSSSFGGVKSQVIPVFVMETSAFKPCFERRTSSSRKWWLSRERPKSCWRRLGIFSLKKRKKHQHLPLFLCGWCFFFLKSITGRLAINLNWLICFAVWPCWTLQGLKCPWRLLQQAARILDAARSIAQGPTKNCEDNLGPREGWFRGCVGGWNATQLLGDYNKPSFQDPYLTTRIQWKVRDPVFFSLAITWLVSHVEEPKTFGSYKKSSSILSKSVDTGSFRGQSWSKSGKSL